MSREWSGKPSTGRTYYKYVPPPIGVPVEDAPCPKCTELTEKCRMQSETIGRYVDEKLDLQNRLVHLAAVNDVLLSAMSDLSRKYGKGI